MWAEQTSDADKSLRVLIVSGDRALEEEFRSALSRIPDRRGSVYFVETYREAIDVARRRQPNLILVDIDRHASEIATLSKDLQAQVPESAIAGTFTPDRLEQGQSEGATIIELRPAGTPEDSDRAGHVHRRGDQKPALAGSRLGQRQGELSVLAGRAGAVLQNDPPLGHPLRLQELPDHPGLAPALRAVCP